LKHDEEFALGMGYFSGAH